MEAVSHHEQEHHHGPLPTSGRALDALAISATLHCLTGCAIGEVTGMVLGTWWGFSNWGTVVLAVALAFLFGYSLTSLPLLRAGLALGTVIPIAFASDTLSIATMEVVDNVIMLAVPGAMEAGLDGLLFWGSLSVALVIAGAVAFPVNRWLLARGKGHAAVHETGIHGGPPIRLVAIVFAVAAVFGTVVLAAEAFDGDGGGHGGEHAAGAGSEQQVRGLSVVDRGLRLELGRAELPLGRDSELNFRIVDSGGTPVRDFEVEHDQRLHLIFVRRDMTGFQHLHPRLDSAGTWKSSITVPDAGSYRVFADFKRDGENYTPASDLAVDGEVDWQELPRPARTADAGAGYQVRIDSGTARAGTEVDLDSRSPAVAARFRSRTTSAPRAISWPCVEATSRTCTFTPRSTRPPGSTATPTTRSRSRPSSRSGAGTACSCSSSTRDACTLLPSRRTSPASRARHSAASPLSRLAEAVSLVAPKAGERKKGQKGRRQQVRRGLTTTLTAALAALCLHVMLPAVVGAHHEASTAASAPGGGPSLAAVPPESCPGVLIQPSQVITGEFGTELQGSFVLVPFDVPAGTTAVRVRYCHDPTRGPFHP
jgi:hypothetical protein